MRQASHGRVPSPRQAHDAAAPRTPSSGQDPSAPPQFLDAVRFAPRNRPHFPSYPAERPVWSRRTYAESAFPPSPRAGERIPRTRRSGASPKPRSSPRFRRDSRERTERLRRCGQSTGSRRLPLGARLPARSSPSARHLHDGHRFWPCRTSQSLAPLRRRLHSSSRGPVPRRHCPLREASRVVGVAFRRGPRYSGRRG